jgi:hypothetical protein
MPACLVIFPSDGGVVLGVLDGLNNHLSRYGLNNRLDAG